MQSLSLCLGSTVTVFDVDEVSRALEKLDAGAQSAQGQRRAYERMLETGAERYISKPSSSSVLDGLVESCPNFEGVLSDLANYVELAAVGKGGLNILPILLAGDPGVGKTHFAKSLAGALGVPFEFVSLGTMTAGWALSGSSATWSGARQGKVADTLIEAKFANPVIVLDEIDKTGGDSRYDPYGALLQLLESETAKHFKDEFLDIALNTSNIFWACTANDLSRIPDFVLSRMAVYEVPAPTTEQARTIAQNIYSELVTSREWPFEPALGGDALDAVATVPPREMKKKLLDGMGRAVREKRSALTAGDVRSSHARTVKSMGFLAP